MQLPKLIPGTLIKRYKRFFADILLADGTEITAHTPNTGRMSQCAVPGYRVMVSPADNPKRKLKYTLELIEVNGHLVDVNTQRSNQIVEEALRENLIHPFQDMIITPEFTYLDSRLDFYLKKGEQKIFLEVKNVTLCSEETASFPDAPTERGRKHLETLRHAVEAGNRGVIFFLVQRPEAEKFSPADSVDPAYGELLREVTSRGVESMAWKTVIRGDSIHVDREIELIL